MKRRVIAFDLDDTLSVTKSPMSDRMSELLGQLLEKYDVCVISGGQLAQFHLQVIDPLNVSEQYMTRLHLMPTCGTRYYRYDDAAHEWQLQYAEDLSDEEKTHIRTVLTDSAKEAGLWPEQPYGDVIEDRESQITFSALGQKAPSAEKYAWSEANATNKQKLRDTVAAALPNLAVRLGGTTSIDVTRIGVDKAYGMEKLIDALGCSKQEILFIGDKLQEGGNDYPVKAMGIDTIEVDGWEDTAFVIEGILAAS